MAGKIGGITDLTGLRVGGDSSTTGAGAGSDVSEGTALYGIVSKNISVTTITALGSQSVTTTAAVPELRSGDPVFVNSNATLSNGVALTARMSADAVLTLIYSAASTTTLTIAAGTVRVTGFRL